MLQTTFGESNSLLESQTYFTQGCRVAVTSTNAPDQEPFLLANYPRPETLDLPRGQDPNLRVWQSVAAAIADPAYFPPFEYDAQTYLDGGLKCGNPAAIADKERRLLWPELSNRERQLVGLILAGYPTALIARRLSISVGTVKNHRLRIYRKLDITTERELFLQYFEQLR